MVWGAAAWTLHRLLNRFHPRRDPILLPVGLLLAGWGEFLILRLSTTFGLRQLVWLAVGVLLTAALLRSPAELRWLRRYRYLWLAGGLGLTALTLLLGTNPAGGEERLWLGCCGVYLQPSEPLRLLLLAYLAAFLADRLAFGWGMNRPGLVAVLAPLVLVWGASTGMLLTERDLGTSTLFIGLLAVMLYLVSDRWQVLLAALVLAVIGAAAAYGLFGIVRLRVLAWLDPWADPMGGSYQVIQGLIAYASGGLFGRGAGIGAPGLVPIAVSDYIFAVVGEEWGLVGALGLIGLYALLVQRGLRAATRNADPFRALLAAGIATAFGLQTVMILGGDPPRAPDHRHHDALPLLRRLVAPHQPAWPRPAAGRLGRRSPEPLRPPGAGGAGRLAAGVGCAGTGRGLVDDRARPRADGAHRQPAASAG